MEYLINASSPISPYDTCKGNANYTCCKTGGKLVDNPIIIIPTPCTQADPCACKESFCGAEVCAPVKMRPVSKKADL